jgi:hypothetical protein
MSAKITHTPGPWFHYTGKLRPQYPTIIHEIQADDGTPVVKWGGFDGVEQSRRQISARDGRRSGADVGGRKIALAQACEDLGLDYNLVRDRMLHGWEFSRASSEPRHWRGSP